MEQAKGFTRKHFFIDRKLQGRYMLNFLVPMLIMLVFMIFTLYFAVQNVLNISTNMIKNDIKNKEAIHFQDQLNPPVEEYQVLLKDIHTYLRNFSNNEKYSSLMLRSLLRVFGIGILVVMIQIGLMTVYFSHKIAGPVYRFERECHTLIEGDYTGKIVLRKGDEMQNLSNLLNEVIRRSRERMISLNEAPDQNARDEIIASLKLKH